MESLAKVLNVDRLKIYTPLELLEAIVHSTEPENLLSKVAIQIRYRKLLDFVIFVYKNATRKM